jgi:hypothetical protein
MAKSNNGVQVQLDNKATKARIFTALETVIPAAGRLPPGLFTSRPLPYGMGSLDLALLGADPEFAAPEFRAPDLDREARVP